MGYRLIIKKGIVMIELKIILLFGFEMKTIMYIVADITHLKPT